MIRDRSTEADTSSNTSEQTSSSIGDWSIGRERPHITSETSRKRDDSVSDFDAHQHPLLQSSEGSVNQAVQQGKNHHGTVLLARNLQESIDDMFLRWINHAVEFTSRPQYTGCGLAIDVLGKMPVTNLRVQFRPKFEMIGDVKNMFCCPFRVTEHENGIDMNHLIRSPYREFQKTNEFIELNTFDEYGRFS